ncbi:hypothetical protein ACOME3_002157 [Neoechinorhynchus agilis]
MSFALKENIDKEFEAFLDSKSLIFSWNIAFSILETKNFKLISPTLVKLPFLLKKQSLESIHVFSIELLKPNFWLFYHCESWFNVLISQGLDIYGSDMCGDYIFSGHTCMLVILAHFITEYVSDNCVLFRLLVWFTCGSGVVCILAAHFHYTVDVVLAVVIASRLFVYYHSLCQCPVMFESSIRQRFIYQIPLFYFAENESTCELRSRVRGAVQIPPSFVSAIGRLRRQFGFGQRVGMSSARRKRVATGDANAGGGGGIGANSHHLRLRRNDDSNETVSLICPQSTRIAAAVNIEAEEDDEAMARRNSVVLVIENDEL